MHCSFEGGVKKKGYNVKHKVTQYLLGEVYTGGNKLSVTKDLQTPPSPFCNDTFYT